MLFSFRMCFRRTRSLLLLFAAFSLTQTLCAQSSVIYSAAISTIAGTGTAGSGGNGGLATAAQLSAVSYVVYDAFGNLYIVDTGNNAIRKVSGGVITTVAGTLGTAGFSGDTGLATAATLSAPNGIAFDSAGNMYIADSTNNRIREVTIADGHINTVAGSGVKASYTADGPALSSPLTGPNAVIIDAYGNLYIADSASNRVLEVTGGQMILYAGSTNSGGIGGDGAAAKLAKFAGPRSLCIDAANNVYLVDKSHSNIRKVSAATGNIVTVAGSATGTAGSTGDNGLATSALLSGPTGCFVDTAGDLYIADAGNQKIRMVNATTGIITTIAGTGTPGYTGDGGAPTLATLSGPASVAVSSLSGQTAIADLGNNVVRAFSSTGGGFSPTSVGTTSSSMAVNASVVTADTLQRYGLATAAPVDFTFGTITGCTVPGAQTAGTTCAAPVAFKPSAPGLRINQVIALDSSNVRYGYPIFGVGNAPAAGLAPGTINSYAGTGVAGSTGDGGSATSATLNTPSSVVRDPAGNLYITVTASNKVRLVNVTTGNIATVAGTGTAGDTGDGAAASVATLNGPTGLAMDATGNAYIADTGNNVIRKISAQTGFISTVAGTGGSAGYTGDGAAATSATLAAPKSVSTDIAGDIFIADTGNNVIREVNTAGTIFTLSAASVGLSAPAGITVDPTGNLYIADTGNNVIRKWNGFALTIVAGIAGSAGSNGDGGAATSAKLNAPTRVALDAAGDLYIADSGNNKIRFISAATGVITTITGTGTAGSSGNAGNATAAELSAPSGLAVDQFGSLYIADTGNNRVEKVDATSAALAFGAVNTNTTTAAQTVTLTNIGNQPLTLSNISISSGFAQTFAGSDCTTTTTLAAGGQCVISVTFTPTSATVYSGSIVVTDNALNNAASTQTVALSGTGTNPGVPTTLVITAGNAQTVTPLSPFTTNLQVQVKDQFSNPSAGVSVIFTAPLTGASGTFANSTNTVTVQTDATGTATATLLTASATRGSFTISGLAAGIATPASFSETIAGNPSPQLQVSYTPATNPQIYGQTIQLTAKLVPSSLNGTNATGTVTFYDKGNSIGTATVISGSATLSYLPLVGSNQIFTASYGGDTNFSASTNSTSAALTVNALAITVAVPSITVPYNPAFGASIPTSAAALAMSATLTGVIAVDTANVSSNATSTGFAYNSSSGALIGTTNVGVYPVVTTLSGSAAPNYTVSSTSGTVTITQAGSSTALTSTSYFPPSGGSVTLTASVSPGTSGTPTGSVSFFDGSVLLGTSTLIAGKATLATTALSLGVNTITAQYSGSTNYSASTSAAITVTSAVADFAFTLSPSSVTLAQGDSAAIAITTITSGSFALPISFTCTGLPVSASCTFVPNTVTPAVSTTTVPPSTTSLLQLAAAGPGTIIGSVRLLNLPTPSLSLLLFGLPAILFAGLLGFGKHVRKLRLVSALFLGALLCIGIGMAGCGSGTAPAANAILTPTGTSTVTVTATAGATTHTATITFAVVPVR